MKVDKIETKFGDVDVEYSTFTKGFFIKSFPDKLKEINGLSLYTSRDNSFKEFSKLSDYVKDVVNNACLEFEFNRKVIAYCVRESSDWTASLSFTYLIANESVKNQKYSGKENQLCEYYVLESSVQKYVGKRNIFGQITGSSDFVIIDYDEETHLFIKNFADNFLKLRMSIVDFFKKDNLKLNIINNSNRVGLLGTGK